MERKLSIIVPHYNESWDICHTLFDSIAVQQGINLDDIEVIIVQDGEDVQGAFSEVKLGYQYKMSIAINDHKGVSAARNLGLDNATGEYVMFCDCDDSFLNNYGLHLVFSAIAEQPDVITSSFIEELKDEDGNYKIIRRDKDITFVHGKVYNRKFLIDKELRFKDELTIHEDGYFNSLALVCADTKKEITTPFYIWKWNGQSTVRRNPENYVLKTYSNLMEARASICRELEKRGYINEFIDCVCKTILDSYYDFNKPAYLDESNKHDVNRAKHAFKKFYDEFKQTFKEAATARKGEIAYIARATAYTNGMLMEQFTIRDFIDEIENEVK